MRALTTSLLFAALATGCGPQFYVEVENPEVCVLVEPQTVPAAPATGVSTYERVFELDFQQELNSMIGSLPQGGLEDLTGELRLRSVRVTLESGPPDLTFIHSALLAVEGPNTDTPLVDVFDYTLDTAAPPPTSIDLVPTQGAFDVYPYLRAGLVTITGAFTGELPTTDWSMSGRACGSLKLRYAYLMGI